MNDPTTSADIERVHIIVEACSGQVRPFQAAVYVGGSMDPNSKGPRIIGGRYLGRTGFCASADAAAAAGQALAARKQRS